MSDIDPRVISAVDHLQKAALELIAAMRNALDVAEDMVGDPTPIATLLQGVLASPPLSPHEEDEPIERVTRIRVD